MKTLFRILGILLVSAVLFGCSNNNPSMDISTGDASSYEKSTNFLATTQTSETTQPETQIEPMVKPTYDEPDDLPTGLYHSVSGLPKIEDFSGTEYEDYSFQFCQVKSAIYRHDGIEENIDLNDPRLIRLINFLAYDKSERLYWERQGPVYVYEIDALMSSGKPMIEVEFYNNLDATTSDERCPEMILIGNYRILNFGTDYEWYDDGMVGLEYAVYESLAYEEFVNNGKEDLFKYFCSVTQVERWTNEDYYWLDMIKYAGFAE